MSPEHNESMKRWKWTDYGWRKIEICYRIEYGQNKYNIECG